MPKCGISEWRECCFSLRFILLAPAFVRPCIIDPCFGCNKMDSKTYPESSTQEFLGRQAKDYERQSHSWSYGCYSHPDRKGSEHPFPMQRYLLY
jgi:hypothetical protein